jgi:anti-sigma regulatory factor (Ser/Thr protein kinase)
MTAKVITTRSGGFPAQPGCRTDSLELGAYESAVPSARLHTRAVLREWRLAPILDDAESVVAELAANAVQATRDAGLDTGIRLTLTSDGLGVLIAMRDAVPLPPVPNHPDADSEHGRGLLIIDALSAWWDSRPVPADRGGGKLVRARIDLPPTPAKSIR